MTTQNETPFLFSDIEDVRIIVKAKGKHYSIVGKNGIISVYDLKCIDK